LNNLNDNEPLRHKVKAKDTYIKHFFKHCTVVNFKKYNIVNNFLTVLDKKSKNEIINLF
jgi:hypothetical protein